jgi:hypothetical protein
MLDIIEWRLSKTGVKTVKLLGSMPLRYGPTSQAEATVCAALV